MTTTVIELVTFKLKQNTDKSVLNNINPKVNDFLKSQTGFLYRSSSEDESGLLYDIVYWQDMACAKQAGAAFEQSEAGGLLMSVTDMDSVTMQYMSAITEAMSCEGTPA
ncbi:hypothetical protein A9Q74_00160 [Colwellia sp. 39_35_sub15_T18]|nr:hypothetical protein A9Q74_00160 [Colwellia sp. 39_35_sub15_T18]